MTREKKSMRKNTRKMNEDVKNMLAEKHDEESRLADVEKLMNAQLFSINANKNDKKREKLQADRFKQEVQKRTSSTEAFLVKRLREKNPPQKHADADAEEWDVWGTPDSRHLWHARFDTFKEKSFAKVKAVILPLGG